MVRGARSLRAEKAVELCVPVGAPGGPEHSSRGWEESGQEVLPESRVGVGWGSPGEVQDVQLHVHSIVQGHTPNR